MLQGGLISKSCFLDSIHAFVNDVKGWVPHCWPYKTHPQVEAPSFLSFSPRFISWKFTDNLRTVSPLGGSTSRNERRRRLATSPARDFSHIATAQVVCVPGQQGCNRPRGCTQHIPRSHCALRCFENFWSAFAFKNCSFISSVDGMF